MPADGQEHRDRFHLYCTDPTDGIAKFAITAPSELSEQPQASDPRTALGLIAIAVDETAPPLVERLELDVAIDDDLILRVAARSCQKADQSSNSYFDLEFGIGFPGSEDIGPKDVLDHGASPQSGGLVARANVADQKNQGLVPGDVLYRHNARAFNRMPGQERATEDQLTEHLYYKPCAVCKRKWGDPNCRCSSAA
jgi:hypothetical protein